MPATPYITPDRFKLLMALPGNVIAQLEQSTPGWLAAQVEIVSVFINARLSKRYRTPFDPPPAIVEQWLVDIVSLRAWLKRGMNATDESFVEYKAAHDRALEQITEAANGETGLIELPNQSADPGAASSGITRGATRSYSETSPYVSLDRQARAAHGEDRKGDGTTR